MVNAILPDLQMAFASLGLQHDSAANKQVSPCVVFFVLDSLINQFNLHSLLVELWFLDHCAMQSCQICKWHLRHWVCSMTLRPTCRSRHALYFSLDSLINQLKLHSLLVEWGRRGPLVLPIAPPALSTNQKPPVQS